MPYNVLALPGPQADEEKVTRERFDEKRFMRLLRWGTECGLVQRFEVPSPAAAGPSSRDCMHAQGPLLELSLNHRALCLNHASATPVPETGYPMRSRSSREF